MFRGCVPSTALHRPGGWFFRVEGNPGPESQAALCHRHEGRQPIGLGGLWENWREPASGEWIRTFAVITTDASELVAENPRAHAAYPAPKDYTRWLGDDPDPRDLMRPYPAEPMRMWPISTRVNKPENDDPSIIDPVELAATG